MVDVEKTKLTIDGPTGCVNFVSWDLWYVRMNRQPIAGYPFHVAVATDPGHCFVVALGHASLVTQFLKDGESVGVGVSHSASNSSWCVPPDCTAIGTASFSDVASHSVGSAALLRVCAIS